MKIRRWITLNIWLHGVPEKPCQINTLVGNSKIRLMGIWGGFRQIINGTSKLKSLIINCMIGILQYLIKSTLMNYWEYLKIKSLGGNYFTHSLKAFRCFVVWDKTYRNSYADCELALDFIWPTTRYFRENIAQTNVEGENTPNQKIN